MRLDEAWLGGLLSQLQAPSAFPPGEMPSLPTHAPVSLSRGEPRVDWGDALAVTSFYGREWELDLLSEWVGEERCRVVNVLGQRGIGKSALATQVMHRVAERFEVVIWRSLRDVPSREALLENCLQVLAPQALREASASPESRQGLLLECLRSRRVLLVYDKLESFLGEGKNTGRMRTDYKGFSRLLLRVAETGHQSCLLLTSREKPSGLVPLEGKRAPVRALRLAFTPDGRTLVSGGDDAVIAPVMVYALNDLKLLHEAPAVTCMVFLGHYTNPCVHRQVIQQTGRTCVRALAPRCKDY